MMLVPAEPTSDMEAVVPLNQILKQSTDLASHCLPLPSQIIECALAMGIADR